MRIDHEFNRIAGTVYAVRNVGEGGNWIKGCVCDNCEEARAAFVAPSAPEETFEEFWERTRPSRRDSAHLIWDFNRIAPHV